jgi:nucleoside-diphosphate-sugar epimerase
MSDKNIDVLIHTAGELVNSGMTYEDQILVFEHNIEITKSIVRIVQTLNIHKLINCSSIAVYPNEDGVYTESSEVRMSCNSECLYGLAKFCSENMFEHFLKEKCDVINLRLAQISGEGMRSDRIISVMKESILRGNVVEVYGEGKRISNFISIEKVCEIITRLLEVDGIRGIFNVGGENLTYLELAQKVVGAYGNSDTRICLKKEGNKSQFILDSSKLDRLWRK